MYTVQLDSPRDESAGRKSRRNRRAVRIAWWSDLMYQKRSFPRQI